MHAHLSRRRPPVLFVLFASLSISIAQPVEAAPTADSPEVMKAIGKGVDYLAAQGDADSRPGALALTGIALLTREKSQDRELSDGERRMVDKCAARIHELLAKREPSEDLASKFDIYSTGLSIIFLVDLDQTEYRDDIQCLLTHLGKAQKEHGGWGYPQLSTGDTSMTQYGVLASWTASNAGFDIPLKSIERATQWLIRTQDPDGGYGYQGKLGENGVLIKQSDVKPSLTAAGMGSLYFCCDLLDLNQKVEPGEEAPPSALKEIKPKEKKDKAKRKTSIDPRTVRNTQERGNQWFVNNFKVDAGQYNNYYFYAFERYMSIRKYCENIELKDNPQWYSDIAAYLLEKQAGDGSWKSDCGAVPDTAFALLFLMRAMNVHLPKIYDGGLMSGGKGLPGNMKDAAVNADGKIVPNKSKKEIDEFLEGLKGQEFPDFGDIGGSIEKLPADEIDSLLKKHGDLFRRMVSDRSPKVRMETVQSLGKTRNLDYFEMLLYAMTDPAPEVVHAANDALLRMRRSPNAVVLPDDFNEIERRKAIEDWKSWYLTIRPDAKFKWSGTKRMD